MYTSHKRDNCVQVTGCFHIPRTSTNGYTLTVTKSPSWRLYNPGPKFFGSIDGYLKLAPYTIEIYAAFNAYFWYIIWINGCISSPTYVRTDAK